MKRIVILDTGHGGIINGVYQTAGKRSPKWEKGVLYEGAYNRWVVNEIIMLLDMNRVPYFHISNTMKDKSLADRVADANKIYKAVPNTYLLSIHGNGGGGTGFEGFTTKGETKADSICQSFLKDLEVNFPYDTMRFDYADGDKDKEVDFYMLRNTQCPAVLLELLFMDNREDYKNMMDIDYRRKLSKVIAGTIINLFKNI